MNTMYLEGKRSILHIFQPWIWCPYIMLGVVRGLRNSAKYSELKRRGTSVEIGEDVTIVNKIENIKLGNHVRFGSHGYIDVADVYIEIGDCSSFNIGLILDSSHHGRIIIGKTVMVGCNVTIVASSHRYDKLDMPMLYQGHTSGQIVIGDDVWVGANAVILPNATIGHGAIIGAGAVVTGVVPPYAIVRGMPANVVKER